MKKRRLGSLLLALCLCMGLALPVHAAGTELTVNAPETLPAVGETFQVTVDISGNPGLGAVQFTLAHDKSVLECVTVKMGSMLSGTLSATNPDASDGARLAAASMSTVSGDGNLATYTFKVLSADKVDFELKDVALSKTDGTAVTAQEKGSNSAAPQTPPASQTPTQQPEQPPAVTTPDAGVKEEEEAETPVVTLPQTFTDVPKTYWASSQIERAASLGLISGYGDGSFKPGNSVTRAQFVTMLWRMSGKPASSGVSKFADVGNLNTEFKQAIAWASENGYVNGVTATSFRPNATITRQQAMAILFRYHGGVSGMELMFTDMYDSQFTDSGSIGAFAKSGVYWAVYNGIVTGVTANTIVPGGTASRAQIAVILLRYADKFQ